MPENVNTVPHPPAGEDIGELPRSRNFSVRSDRDPNVVYLSILFDNGKGWCSCPSRSWYFCKHLIRCVERVADLAGVDDEIIELPPEQEERLDL